ncbi:MAG TPA: serine/threonine-protein kinase [Myxococcales bacterium]|jgi:hypothetical protein
MKKKPEPFGQYLLLEPIKAGGMSEIWRARPDNGSAVVAIKRVLPQYAKDPDILGMFLDEARVAVQLSHPNIARVFDLGRVGDDLFLAMEYVPGSDLRAIFKRAAERGSLMPIPLAVFVISKICDALDHAHRCSNAHGVALQIVHRDVAPDNCLVTFDGEVKLIDFGVAKASTQSNKTKVGVLKGKLSYMSPEQVAGLTVDRRSDLFSLGIVLYEMVTGRRLFWRESPLAILEAVRGAPVEPPSKVNPKVPPLLERIILKALQKHREVRYEWASEMGTALRECLADLPLPPNAAHLRKYMSLMFVDELKAERARRTEWAQDHHVPAPAPPPLPNLGEALEGRPEDEAESAKLPTLMEKPRPKKPLPPPPRETGLFEPDLDAIDAIEDADIEFEDRPTLLPSQLPDMSVPDQLLDPVEELPPPMPSPDRPTVALQVFVEEGLDLDLEEDQRGRADPGVPAQPAKRKTGVLPAAPLRKLGVIPAAPLRKSGSLPAAPLRKSGSLPADPLRRSGSLPADPLRRSGALPAGPVRKPDKKS